MEIKYNERIRGNGLYASQFYPKHAILWSLNGDIQSIPTRYTIHIGNHQHIHDPWGIYMNHSFTPSARIDGRNVVAMKDIEVGDEITFNYNKSEDIMAAPFYAEGRLVTGNEANGDAIVTDDVGIIPHEAADVLIDDDILMEKTSDEMK